MSYEQLIALQGYAAIFLLICLVAGALFFLFGLIKPAWVRRGGRGSVVLVSIGIWLLGIVAYAGTVGYTHSHPNGPHSAKRYIDDYFAEQCAQGADLPACRKDAIAPPESAAPATSP